MPREGVRIVSTFYGDPAELTAIAHQAGAVMTHTVASPIEAKRAVDCGVQGWEAGGHVQGGVSTLALVPIVVDAVAPIPVIAAGGIADGRGLAAVLALGASVAWIGTRFLASREAAIHERYRELLLSAGATDTEYTRIFDIGWPGAAHRVIRNSTLTAWNSAGRPDPDNRPGKGEVIAMSAEGEEILRYESHTPGAGDVGDLEAGSLWCGQGVGLVKQVQNAADIVKEIYAESQAILRRLGQT